MNSAPKISIVIPSYNQGAFIEQTIVSILEQDYKNYEIIIIDGGSTDETIDVIRKYETHISYWVSEEDNGQADAINKGLDKVTGDVFNWINSDDYLELGALTAVANAFEKSNFINVVCGYTRCFWNDDNSTSHEYRMGRKAYVVDTILQVEMNQPGTFYRTSVIKDLGGVNASLRYVFDDELWFRYLSQFGFKNIKFIKNRLAQFRLHRSSKSVGEGFDAFHHELAEVYYYLAQKMAFPKWLLSGMKTSTGVVYDCQHEWRFNYINREKYFAWFAAKYAHDAFQKGFRKEVKTSLQLAFKHGYFNWDRMHTSLFFKTLFS